MAVTESGFMSGRLPAYLVARTGFGERLAAFRPLRFCGMFVGQVDKVLRSRPVN